MRSRTPLALMEQTVMVLVFALAAVLCLRVFVWSDLESQRGAARDKAAVAAQNAAERIRHTWADGNGTADGIETGDETGGENWLGELTVFYDRDWNELAGPGTGDTGSGASGSAAGIPGEAAYILTVRGTDTGIEKLAAAHVAVTEKKSGKVLFELDTAWQKEAVR